MITGMLVSGKALLNHICFVEQGFSVSMTSISGGCMRESAVSFNLCLFHHILALFHSHTSGPDVGTWQPVLQTDLKPPLYIGKRLTLSVMAQAAAIVFPWVIETTLISSNNIWFNTLRIGKELTQIIIVMMMMKMITMITLIMKTAVSHGFFDLGEATRSSLQTAFLGFGITFST